MIASSAVQHQYQALFIPALSCTGSGAQLAINLVSLLIHVVALQIAVGENLHAVGIDPFNKHEHIVRDQATAG